MINHPYYPHWSYKVPYSGTIKNIFIKPEGIYYELEENESISIPEENIFLRWEEMVAKVQDILEKFLDKKNTIYNLEYEAADKSKFVVDVVSAS